MTDDSLNRIGNPSKPYVTNIRTTHQARFLYRLFYRKWTALEPLKYVQATINCDLPSGISCDTGWKITIDRGLDIFQWFESGPFSVEQAIQEARLVRGADISYVRL